MGKEFINPNWHVILIHVPLGVFVLGMIIELFSFLYRHSSIRIVARGMIWLGALSAIPAATTGIYAFANVVRMELPAAPANQPWADVAAAASQTEANPGGLTGEQWEFLSRHAWAQGISTIVAALLATIAFGCSDRWRQRLQIPLMAGLLFALAAMIWGAYFGGEMVYRHGTAVQVVQERGATPEASTVPSTGESAADEQTEIKRGVERYVPPVQLHVLLAGLTIAVAFAALGMSLRVMTTADQWRDPEVSPARNLLDLETGPMGGRDELNVGRSLNPDADFGAGPVGIPSARFWLLAALLTLGTMLAGWLMLSRMDEVGTMDPQAMWKSVVGKPRRLYHVGAGGAILVSILILALVARFARRSKFLLGFFSLVLLLAVALQVWLGVLLMFDTPNGELHRFNPATSNVAASQ